MTSVARPPTTGRPLPRPFVAAVAYAARVCIPPKRMLLALLPCAGLELIALLSRGIERPLATGRFIVVTDAVFPLVLPLACLVIGDAVLGAEVRTGTFALTWLTPARFSTIVLARWIAGFAISSVALVLATTVASLVAGLPEAIGPLALAMVAASAAYTGLFLLIGASVRRAALWSLAVVLLGELLLGSALAGIAQLSPQWLATMVYAGTGPDGDRLVREGLPLGWAAVGRLALVTVVTVGLAIRRLRNLRLVGAGE